MAVSVDPLMRGSAASRAVAHQPCRYPTLPPTGRGCVRSAIRVDADHTEKARTVLAGWAATITDTAGRPVVTWHALHGGCSYSTAASPTKTDRSDASPDSPKNGSWRKVGTPELHHLVRHLRRDRSGR